MHLISTHGWRLLLVASGVVLAVGGPMHPAADAQGSLREELATMTADERWVPGHSLVVVSTVLLAAGLWVAYRRDAWPVSVRRPLLIASVAVSLYVVETVAHLAAVLDSDALAHGHAAPVAWTHIGLASVLYPVAGWAIAYLAWSFVREWHGWRRMLVGVGALAGLLHAFAVPLTILFPDVDTSPVFAAAAMLIALWSVLTGAVGAPRPAPVAADEDPVLV